MGLSAARVRATGLVAGAAVIALVGGSLVFGATAGNSAPTVRTETFGYQSTAQSWTVPAGVTAISVIMRGGEGGNGGKDAAPAPDPGTFRGLVMGTVDVVPGTKLTIAPGGAGVTGQDSVGGAVAPAQGGDNPLAGYNGGTGGRTGTKGSSGQGGAGGAASVLRIDGVDVVAAGGGGNGGSGQFAPTRGRPADGTFVGRSDTPNATDGQTGMDAGIACAASSCTNDDGGGSGGGGGGAVGGKQGAVEFGAGTSNEWFGYGGSVGQNATASFAGLTASYEYVPSNSHPGSIEIRYVTGTSEAPAAPQATAGNSSASLTWGAPTNFGVGPIQGYAVQQSADGGTTWSEAKLTGSAATNVVVDGLQNGTAYIFRVAAITPAGTGDFSPASASVTPMAPPSAPEITGVDSRDGMLETYFSVPETGAAPTGYQYRVDDGPWVTLPTMSQPARIYGLKNGVAVAVQLRALSDFGVGAESEPRTGTPIGKPGAPTVTGVSVTSDSATISFTEGYDGGSAITVHQVNVDGRGWVSMGSAGSPITVTGLEPGKTATVLIRSGNGTTFSDASNPVTVTTAAAPAKLENVQAERGDGSITISYEFGASNGSPITGVEYSLDSGDTWLSGGTSAPLVITKLANGTEQQVQLRPVNAIGAGEAVTVFATPAGVPGAPLITELVDSGEGSWRLELSAPEHSGGSAITGYSYTTDAGATWQELDGASPFSVSKTSAGEPLLESERYEFSVRARNEVGYGPASRAQTEEGPAAVPLPNAPVIVTVAPLSGALAVTFSASGSAPISGYEYSVDGGTWTAIDGLTPKFTITGLTDGVPASVRVRAVNATGAGEPSAAVAGTPRSVPLAPTLDSLTRTDGALTVALTSAGDGGSAITDYEYSLDGGAWTSTGSTDSTITIVGLQNGTSYAVQIRAKNAAGAGSGSNVLIAAPASAPSAPELAGTPGDSTVSVQATFASDGGSPLTRIEYRVSGTEKWIDARSLTGVLLLTGLTNGEPLVLEVRGVNAIGNGTAERVTVTPMTVPGTPTNVKAVGNSSSADIAWDAPKSDGGSPITQYEVVTYDASNRPVMSSYTSDTFAHLPSLTNGQTYTVTVAALNAAGYGPASSPRVAVTPRQRPAAPVISSFERGDQFIRVTFQPGVVFDSPLTGYEYTTDSGKTWIAAQVPGSATALTVPGLKNGVTADIQIRATSDAGPSLASNVVRGAPYGYPKAPTSVSAAPGDKSVTASWTPADLNGNTLSKYLVVAFSAASGGTRVAECETTSTSCTLTGTSDGKTKLTNGSTVYVSVQTETTQTGEASPFYSERSEPRVAVTPNAAGTAPTLAAQTRTADGFTAKVTNYSATSTYEVVASAGAAKIDASGVITVTGLATGASASVTVTVSRAGYTSATASISSTALETGVPPVFGEVVRGDGSFRVPVTFPDDPNATVTFFGDVPEHAVTTMGPGYVEVTGLADGASGTVTVSISRSGFTEASASVTGSALDAAVVPQVSAIEPTANGFTFEITNHDDAAFAVETGSGSASVDPATGRVTVSGLAAGESATVTVRSTRDGAKPGSASVDGAALKSIPDVKLATPERRADGFTVAIENFDSEFTYEIDEDQLPEGVTAEIVDGSVVVSGSAPGTPVTIPLRISREGYTPTIAEVTGAALPVGVAPVLGEAIRTADGFSMEILNFDEETEYLANAILLPQGGQAGVDGIYVRVSGLAPGQAGQVIVVASREGRSDAATTATGSALNAAVAPTFGVPQRTSDGYTVEISNFDADAEYVLSVPEGLVAKLDGSRIVVTGADPAEEVTVEVRVVRDGFVDGTASITAFALDADDAPGDDADGAGGGAGGGADAGGGAGAGGAGAGSDAASGADDGESALGGGNAGADEGAAAQSGALAATGAPLLIGLASFGGLLVAAGAVLTVRRRRTSES
ncbi:fibronectin type III domain-containing protein [Leucobacter sp. USHLN153]|uniref:fibronectin type III domain-containing protein n=1 Tax=Leucobacter sp. USHLN153 TaxID=3081268 RepID=UPI0030186E3A